MKLNNWIKKMGLGRGVAPFPVRGFLIESIDQSKIGGRRESYGSLVVAPGHVPSPFLCP
jgi:hypothetical protein